MPGIMGGGNQTVTTSPDPVSAARASQIWNAAMGVFGGGPGGGQGVGRLGSAMGYGPLNINGGPGIAGADPNVLEALRNYQGMAGNLGFGTDLLRQFASQGGPNQADLQGWFNPYQSQVMDAARSEFGNTREATMRAVADQATSAGAFGGSRAAVAQGQALGDLGRAENSQIAGLLQSGYGDAMNRYMANQQQRIGVAGGLANFGLAGTQGMLGIGDYLRGIEQQRMDLPLRNLGFLQGLNSGMPQGQSQTMSTQQNPLAGLLGMALTFGPMLFGAPPGAAGGGGGGWWGGAATGGGF